MDVTRKELAELFGVTPYAISQYGDNGLPNNGKKGQATKYPLKECIKWFVEWEKKKATKNTPASTDTKDLESELLHWKVQRAKHSTLREAGTLITIDDSIREISHRLGQVRDALLTVEFSWAPFLVGLPDTDKVQVILRDKVDELMASIASLPDSEDEQESYETTEIPEPSIPVSEASDEELDELDS